MTTWILAIVLLASLAAMGYRQGVIRVGFSLAGILIGALLAGLVGKLIRPIFAAIGMKDPLLLAAIPPVIAFILIFMLFKVAAMTVHRKVDVHFRYQAGELRFALWERLQRRLGLCLGLFNGTLYF